MFTVEMTNLTAAQLTKLLEKYPNHIVMVSSNTGETIATGPATPDELKHRYRDGKRNKGISGRDLVLTALHRRDGKMTYDAVGRAFVSRGFAEQSFGATISKLYKQGLVGRGEEGKRRYVTLTDAGRKIADAIS